MKVLVGVILMGVGALWMGSAVFVVLIFGGLGVPGSIAVTTASMLPGALPLRVALLLSSVRAGSPPGRLHQADLWPATRSRGRRSITPGLGTGAFPNEA